MNPSTTGTPCYCRNLTLITTTADSLTQLEQRARAALGKHSQLLQRLILLRETPYLDLHPCTPARLFMNQNQKQVQLKLEFSATETELSAPLLNQLRYCISQALNQSAPVQEQIVTG